MSITDAIAEDLRRLKLRVRDVEYDVGIQLAGIQTQVRTERRLAEDRHETQMLRFDQVDAALESIAMKLSANGSGHG